MYIHPIQMIMCQHDSSFERERIIWIHEGRLYRVTTPSHLALIHIKIIPIKIWHKIYGHIHYKIIPSLIQMVKGIPNIKEDHEGVCKGSAIENKTRKPFTSSDTRSKEILDLIDSDVCGPMSNKSL